MQRSAACEVTRSVKILNVLLQLLFGGANITNAASAHGPYKHPTQCSSWCACLNVNWDLRGIKRRISVSATPSLTCRFVYQSYKQIRPSRSLGGGDKRAEDVFHEENNCCAFLCLDMHTQQGLMCMRCICASILQQGSARNR